MTVAYVSRADWGALSPKRNLTRLSPADSLVVHHLGDGQLAPLNREGAGAVLRATQATHQAGEYADIAYNMAVSQQGDVFELRGLEFMGGATWGANDHTRAVLWLGDSRDTAPTDAALSAIAEVYRMGVSWGALASDAAIKGHRDYVATACPGPQLYALLPQIRALIGSNPLPPLGVPTGGDDEMTPEQSQAFAIMTGVLTPTYDPYGRPVSLADVAHVLHTNLPQLASAVAANQAGTEAVLATLRSIDAKMEALVRGMTAAKVNPPNADELVAALLARLAAQPPRV